MQFLLAALTAHSQTKQSSTSHGVWPKVGITRAVPAPNATPGASAGTARMLCPGATQWQVNQENLGFPGSFYSCCFHTQGFCRARRGKRHYFIIF